ncbi:MAG: putative methyltransferase [Archaeoglobales archaeon]|nr:MAG: putative methyltransferase [Archaeoglobales archaeon]
MMERIRRQILQALDGEMSVYRLIDSQDASLREFFDLLQAMEREGLISVKEGKVSLTERGKKLKEELCAISVDVRCKCCRGTGYVVDFAETLRRYEEIARERPEAIEVYDQGFMATKDVMRRVEFVYERGDLATNIFVVGDDDLFSIAASLTGIPKKITVVEIDERLVNFINKTADKHGLNIEAVVYDVQQAFPEEYRKKYDVFVTDPVETLPGLKLFLSRGVSTLKGPGCSGYFGITTLEASRKKWYEIQRMIYDMGFIITDLRRKFSVYPPEDKNFFRFQEKLPIVRKLQAKVDWNWYTSTLFRIEAVVEPKPIVEGEMIIDEKVYKDDESWATPY